MEGGKKSLRDQFWKEVLIGLLIIYFSFGESNCNMMDKEKKGEVKE